MFHKMLNKESETENKNLCVCVSFEFNSVNLIEEYCSTIFSENPNKIF